MIRGAQGTAIAPQKKGKGLLRRVLSSWQLYVMGLPTMILLFCFNYWPMYGMVLAFKKQLRVRDGLWGSPWSNPIMRNFQVLTSRDAQNAIWNTLYLNFLFIIVGTLFALALALAFNEVRHRRYKQITQSLSFLPFFISTVVLGIFASGLLGYDNGSINGLITGMGGEKIQFFARPQYWPMILLITVVWKGAGYNSVIYMATIAGIDAELYEAAKIDGASRWGEMWYISLPMLRSTIIVLTLLAVGKIMNADFGLFYNVTQDIPTLYEATDVIDTFVYRLLRKQGSPTIATAVGLFQSSIAFVLVIVSNMLARKVDEGAALF